MKWFSNRKSKDEKALDRKLTEARDAQRAGKIQDYAQCMVEAEAIRSKIEQA